MAVVLWLLSAQQLSSTYTQPLTTKSYQLDFVAYRIH